MKLENITRGKLCDICGKPRYASGMVGAVSHEACSQIRLQRRDEEEKAKRDERNRKQREYRQLRKQTGN